MKKIVKINKKIWFYVFIIIIILFFFGIACRFVYETAYLTGWNDALNWIRDNRYSFGVEILERNLTLP